MQNVLVANFLFEKKSVSQMKKVMACHGRLLIRHVHGGSAYAHWWPPGVIAHTMQFGWDNEANINSLNNSQTFEAQLWSTIL